MTPKEKRIQQKMNTELAVAMKKILAKWRTVDIQHEETLNLINEIYEAIEQIRKQYREELTLRMLVQDNIK